MNDAAVYRPESPQYSKQAALAAAVWTHDQEVLLRKVDHIRSRSRVSARLTHPTFHVEAQASHQYITVWRYDWYAFKLDLFGLKDFATTLQHWEERVSENTFDSRWASVRLTFSPSEALPIIDFLKFAALTSDIVSKSSETRAV